ncbi:MAG: hypothetical protein RBT74_02105 [Tenuifilaceae bacterium]|nr:hypothetical protein [Tenuifilaceae bacterium]
MIKTFTPILWNFQSYSNQQIDELYDLNNLLKPLEEFQNLLKDIDEKAPEASDEIVTNILNQIH